MPTAIQDRADIYTDLNGLDGLRQQARENSREALRAVAKQFEAMFLQTLLKTSRQAGFGDPLFDSDRMDFYNDMYDKQMSLTLANGGTGLADVLTEQLGRSLGMNNQPPQKPEGGFAVPSRSHLSAIKPYDGKLAMEGMDNGEGYENSVFDSPRDFVQRMWPHAEQAAEELGVSPKVLIAQAALETGWGKSITRDTDGQSSYNLFNIKADGRWQGETVEVATMEFIGGQWVQQQASFRRYNSYEESFQDYVKFLKENPRYTNALEQRQGDHGYARELQKSGYATDPDYARKIGRIMQGNVMSDAMQGIKISQDRPLTQRES